MNTQDTKAMKQVEIAKSYIGQREKPHNGGFIDESFETKMTAVGFKKGDAWCSTFAKLVFLEAFPEQADKLKKLMTPGTLLTYSNLKKAGYKTSDRPTVGALVIYQRYKDNKPQPAGHAGIVVAISGPDEYVNVEGNTNASGSPEGTDVLKKARKIGKVATGLNVLGFVTIE